MAGDWIKMRGCLSDEPEVIAIAAATGIEEDAVVGKLLRIWFWADQHTTDGSAARVTKVWIDRCVSAAGFADAMIEVGWLRVTEHGIQIPDFEKHNTETGKKRALAANRAAKVRSAHRCATRATKSAPTEEKRREDIEVSNDTSNPLKSPKGDDSEAGSPKASKRSDAQSDAPPKAAKGSYPKAFEAWWKCYPLKVGKEAALRAWTKAGKRLRAQGMTQIQAVERMQTAVEVFAASPKGRGDFCPNPATWLNRGSYDDDPKAWLDRNGESNGKHERSSLDLRTLDLGEGDD